MSGSGSSLRHVLRSLRRSPLFTIITLVTIALAVGGNAAIFSIVNGIVLKPFPYPEPDRLVSIRLSSPVLNLPDMDISPADYLTFRDESRTFAEVGIWHWGNVSVTGLEAPEQVPTLNASDGVLRAIGVPPALGRWFSPEDVKPRAASVTILTHGYWQRRFGDAGALGRKIMIDGEPSEIIGVMPAGFRFLDGRADLIRPMQLDRAKATLGNYSYDGIARLKPGVSVAQANADVGRMLALVLTRFPPPPGFSAKLFEQARIQPMVRPLREQVIGTLAKVLWVLMGSLGVVLLIACANVANLLLVRSEGRHQELAIRAALGAGSRQIAGSLLLESFVLGIAGGAVGLGLAFGALRALVAYGPSNLPRLDSIGINATVVLFTFAVSLLAAAVFGFLPVLRYASPRITAALRSGGRTLSQSREAHRTRNVLVVLQVALALVLLIASGLMIRTFQALRRVDPGFRNPAQLQTLRIYLPETQVKDSGQALRVMDAIRQKLAAIPGVQSAAFANSVATDGNNSTDILYAEDRTYREGQLPPLRRFKFVTPGFFETMGTPLVAGRDYTWDDLYDYRPLTIVSENFAREMWGEPGKALGKRIREGMKDRWAEIIGVVADVRHDGPDQPAPATIYWPLLMKQFWGNQTFLQRGVAYVVRSDRAGSDSLLKDIQQSVWSVNSNLPLARVRTVARLYQEKMARSSFTLAMLAIAGGMALLLGIVGIYGVISYSVTQRRREMGIRIALGAQRGTLESMVVGQGVILASIGVVLGLAAAVGVTRVLTTFLYGIGPLDVVTYAAVSVGLLGAAALASYLPAHKASSVSPVEALRAE